jgi:hypothetical protein
VILAFATAGCAPLLYGHPQSSAFAARRMPPYNPVGQWLAVMDLRPTDIIGVMALDGAAHSGRFVGASAQEVRLLQQGQVVSVERANVARVDLLHRPASGVAGKVALGALGGAAAVAATEVFLGGVFGGRWVAPSRRGLAAGAAAGAIGGAMHTVGERQSRVIYVAPELSPSRPW